MVTRTWSRCRSRDFGATGPRSDVACDRSRAVRDVAARCRGPARPRADPGVTARRHRHRHGRGAGGLGRTGRLLQPITLRHRRLHRLLPVRGRRHGARPGVRFARARPAAGQRTQRRGGAAPRTRIPIPSSRARTVTSGCACCRRGSGAACGLAGGARRSSRTPPRRCSARVTPRRRRSACWSTRLFADKTMEELVAEGQAHGVPIAAVLTPARSLASEHFQRRGRDHRTPSSRPGVHTDVPTGYFVVDGDTLRLPDPGPVGRSTIEPHWLRQSGRAAAANRATVGDYPFAGCGSSTSASSSPAASSAGCSAISAPRSSRSKAPTTPTGCARLAVGAAMSESFAWTHRNELASGLDLRSARARRFSAGWSRTPTRCSPTSSREPLPALGFSYAGWRVQPADRARGEQRLRRTGPWSDRMGYGPLVRAATGVSRLWTSDGREGSRRRHSFYDATTIFPDHVVGGSPRSRRWRR